MSAAAESDFHSRVSAYGDFAEQLGPEAGSSGSIIDVLSRIARDAEKQFNDMPEPVEELFDFIQRNRISLNRRDEDTVDGLIERLQNAFEYIKKDVEENIWNLLDDGVDPVSLEYVDSLIMRSLDGYLNFLEDPYVGDDREEIKSDAFRYLKGFYYGFDRLQLLVEEKKIDDSEKEAINGLETDMEKDNMFVGEAEEEQPKLKASII